MQDLTTGSITRHLLKTASFMLVTMVFQTLYFLVDLYWVGRLGKEAVAAVGIAGNLTFIVLAVSQMLGVGTTTLVSHATGRKDHEHALLVFNQSQSLSVLVGAIFFVVTMLLRDAYSSTLGADPQTALQARQYLTWFIPAMALQFAMVAMGAALRGTGNFKPGTVVATATVILNMALAPVLIFGWGTGVPLGVAGAAISSLVAVAVGVVWLSTYFITPGAYLRFVPSQWVPRFPLWSQMLKIGLPAGAEFALIAVYLFVVYAISRPFGAAAQAGFGIGLRVVQAGFMPVVALGFSVAPVAGQNFGARLGDRVKKTYVTATGMAVGFMAVWAFACHFGAAPIGTPVLERCPGDRRRRGVSAHHRVDVCRIGDRVRVVEHVSGARQHATTAGRLVRTHAIDGPPRHPPRADAGLPTAMDLVSLGRDDRLSGNRRALAPAARVSPAAGVGFDIRGGVGDCADINTRLAFAACCSQLAVAKNPVLAD